MPGRVRVQKWLRHGHALIEFSPEVERGVHSQAGSVGPPEL